MQLRVPRSGQTNRPSGGCTAGVRPASGWGAESPGIVGVSVGAPPSAAWARRTAPGAAPPTMSTGRPTLPSRSTPTSQAPGTGRRWPRIPLLLPGPGRPPIRGRAAPDLSPAAPPATGTWQGAALQGPRAAGVFQTTRPPRNRIRTAAPPPGPPAPPGGTPPVPLLMRLAYRPGVPPRPGTLGWHAALPGRPPAKQPPSPDRRPPEMPKSFVRPPPPRFPGFWKSDHGIPEPGAARGAGGPLPELARATTPGFSRCYQAHTPPQGSRQPAGSRHWAPHPATGTGGRSPPGTGGVRTPPVREFPPPRTPLSTPKNM